MPQPDFDLARVISPITEGEFFTQYWERRPLVVQRENPGYYHGLLSMRDVDHIICATGLRYPALRLVKTGSQIPVSGYTRDLPWGGDTFTKVVDTERVFAEYEQGATIVLQALHRSWRPLGLFCRDLEERFLYPVQTNIYLTPPAAQGFAAHYDTHDVFVLQMAGAKHWCIYDSPVPLPDKNIPYNSSSTPAPQLVQEVDLRAGDLIYLPRGFIHEALTSDSESLHVTVGVIAYTWGDLFAEALGALRRQDPRFRQSVPLEAAARDNRSALAAEFAALVEAFAAGTDPEQFIHRAADSFAMSRPPLLEGRLADINSLTALDGATPVRRRRGIIYRIDPQGDTVALRYEGKAITMPDYVMPALQFMGEQERFTADDLPGGIDAAGRRVLVRRLVKEGFLTIVRGD
jgi:ribosomal protein L16 Arg81 hydroxylase